MKSKENRNISEFSDWKLKFTVTKPGALSSIGFYEDPNDPWFLEVVTYKTKSGAISETSMIIQNDINTWLSHLKSMGYTHIK